MEIQKCAKCGKRPAVVFVTRMEDGKTFNEGLCLVCARSLGIKPVEDILKKMGINDEDIENMSAELDGLTAGDDGEDGGAPAIDLPKIFGNFGMPGMPLGGTEGATKRRKNQTGEAPKDDGKKMLRLYATDLTEQARRGKLDRIVGRDRELDRVIQILCRRQKNNPCLIGEPGVGKTAIAEALALRIAEGNVPDKLASSEIWLLDLTALVAGTQFRGQFEQRILGLLREVKAAGNVILMIDEVHNIVGAGDSEGSMSAANILKPALSRGEIRVIGATTLKEYRKFIEKDTALERRFQPVNVGEPSVSDTADILSGIKNYYENFHAVKISEAVCAAAVRLSERYITDRFLPDKAIDLLDEAASRKSISTPVLAEYREKNGKLTELRAKREALEAKMESAEEKRDEDYKELADLKVEELRLTDAVAALKEKADAVALTVSDLADVIEIWTGVPATQIKAGEIEELKGLEDRISAKVIGQPEAVSAVVRAVKRKRAGVNFRPSPVSMIFAGPTGVGKTELVKVLSRELFRQPESLIRLDMSEFMEKHSVSRIIGAPPGYVGFDEAGQLTEKIRRRPYAVVLFDEIEKAHPDVMNILLQILDEGKITDAQGRVVNFENTVIIMTTNAGSETSSAISGFTSSPEKIGEEKTQRALASFLRPEFINRVDEIITFRSLSEDDFVKIAALRLDEIKNHLETQGTRLTYTDEVLKLVAKESFSTKYGARNMRRYIERNVEDLLANAVIDAGGSIVGAALTVQDGKIVCQTL